MRRPAAGIIGKGTIGSELYSKLISRGWAVKWVMGSKGFFSDPSGSGRLAALDYDSQVRGLDVVFLAIPTLDGGETALGYIRSALDAGVPVVTCEKGALSNYFPELEAAMENRMLGYSATVGGGCRLLGYLQERAGPQVEEVHAVVNGTLNYLFQGLAKGKSLDDAVQEVKMLGYAEPGKGHPLDTINKEASSDIPMKAAILFNVCNFAKEKIRARDLAVQKIDAGQLAQLVKEAANRRYIVSITRGKAAEEGVVRGFEHRAGPWHISGGFRRLDGNPIFRRLVSEGANNAVVTHEGKDGTYVLTGPGAGPGPTALSMVLDAGRILREAKIKRGK